MQRTTNPREVEMERVLSAGDIKELRETVPRIPAGDHVYVGAKARAVLRGRLYASTEDVAAVAGPVLAHRLVTNFNAEAEGVTASSVVERLLEEVPRGFLERE
jgi:MoxR-like ATPase